MILITGTPKIRPLNYRNNPIRKGRRKLRRPVWPALAFWKELYFRKAFANLSPWSNRPCGSNVRKYRVTTVSILGIATVVRERAHIGAQGPLRWITARALKPKYKTRDPNAEWRSSWVMCTVDSWRGVGEASLATFGVIRKSLDRWSSFICSVKEWGCFLLLEGAELLPDFPQDSLNPQLRP